jgi:hypothetical protein
MPNINGACAVFGPNNPRMITSSRTPARRLPGRSRHNMAEGEIRLGGLNLHQPGRQLQIITHPNPRSPPCSDNREQAGKAGQIEHLSRLHGEATGARTLLNINFVFTILIQLLLS